MKILMLIYSDSFIHNSILTRAIRIPLEFTQQTLTTSARDFWSLLRTSYFHFSEARIVRGGGGGGAKIKEGATLRLTCNRNCLQLGSYPPTVGITLKIFLGVTGTLLGFWLGIPEPKIPLGHDQTARSRNPAQKPAQRLKWA